MGFLMEADRPTPGVAGELERIAVPRDRGYLSKEYYAAAIDRVLSGREAAEGHSPRVSHFVDK